MLHHLVWLCLGVFRKYYNRNLRESNEDSYFINEYENIILKFWISYVCSVHSSSRGKRQNDRKEEKALLFTPDPCYEVKYHSIKFLVNKVKINSKVGFHKYYNLIPKTRMSNLNELFSCALLLILMFKFFLTFELGSNNFPQFSYSIAIRYTCLDIQLPHRIWLSIVSRKHI